MRKTQILLWKTIESNRRLRVRVRFLLIYSELALTDPWCNVLRPWLYLVGKNMRRQCQMSTLYAKDWSSHFWESQPFRFWYVEVHCQRRLKSTKTGISSKFKTLARPETENLVFFLWEKFYIRKFCSVKARGFWFKN